MEHFIERMNIFYSPSMTFGKYPPNHPCESVIFFLGTFGKWLTFKSFEWLDCLWWFYFRFRTYATIDEHHIKQLKRKWLVFEHLMKGQPMNDEKKSIQIKQSLTVSLFRAGNHLAPRINTHKHNVYTWIGQINFKVSKHSLMKLIDLIRLLCVCLCVHCVCSL